MFVDNVGVNEIGLKSFAMSSTNFVLGKGVMFATLVNFLFIPHMRLHSDHHILGLFLVKTLTLVL